MRGIDIAAVLAGVRLLQWTSLLSVRRLNPRMIVAVVGSAVPVAERSCRVVVAVVAAVAAD